MKSDTNFDIIDNKLNTDTFIPRMRLENDHYLIRIYYNGNYVCDKTNNNIDLRKLSLSCKRHKATALCLDYNEGIIYIHADIPTILLPDDTAKIINTIEKAKLAADNLQTIINQYFIAYVRK